MSGLPDLGNVRRDSGEGEQLAGVGGLVGIVRHMNSRQRILLETTTARDGAEAMLRGLLDARARSEQHLTELGSKDAMKLATGSSSIDKAIASTRGVIETLDRTIAQIKREFSDEDFALLEAEESPV